MDRFINPIPNLTGAQIERFWSKVNVIPGLCWEWQASRSKTGGYGQVHILGKVYRAHRIAYALLMGDTPQELDHVCRNRLCVNPDHLEPVTAIANWRRGYSPAAIQARKSRCKRGHEFTPDNTIPVDGGRGRKCRTCYVADYQERVRLRSAARAARRAERKAA